MNSRAFYLLTKTKAAAIPSSATISCRSAVATLQRQSLRRMSSMPPEGSSGSPGTNTNADLEILDLALSKVNDLGWTCQAVISAANELGYSSMASGVAESGGVGLVSHFMDRALDETRIEIDDQLHEFDNTKDKLRFLCRTRLRMTRPYIRRWPEAAALLAQPQNVPLAMRHLGELSSQMWYLADDQSKRIDWYARRVALAGVYLSTELYMCEDKSPDFQVTWSFLDRRIDEMNAAEGAGLKALAFGEQFSRNLFNILASHGYVSR